ncbi:hypothetical protein [Bradyrhizobium sp. CER78]|uniref:hypothetical protein n=1 Tax=Bradyrhizobium sp. CER78 TaxID=3039162 RepID=UPI002446B25B|nr:hypothetical protein [Bradyrhizobium sp. CER78]MDH2384729.1 hypothetical protein [Bradyrhizobium sp. CER78]
MTLSPRPDQVAELTRGAALPIPAIASPLLGVIIDALREAWQQLASRYGTALHGKSEPELTALMQSRLNDLRNDRRKFGQIVSCIVRGAESISYDGRHIEKRPDLSIFMTTRNANFPLVVECKIIDHDLGKGVALYCNNGVRRFVDGEYGWASTQALMIGYVCDDSSVEKHLIPHLKTRASSKSDSLKTKSWSAKAIAASMTSDHLRTFRYLTPSPDSDPGPVTIFHIWTEVPRDNI